VSGAGRGDIQASFEGSAGREGKYFSWRVVRKVGEEGSRVGGLGGLGKWIFGGTGNWVDDAGVRSGGGNAGSASGSTGVGPGADCDVGGSRTGGEAPSGGSAVVAATLRP
jgi:hypothetical protein